MSGICGIYSPKDPALASRELLDEMTEAIAHRGMAQRRAFVDQKAGIAIGHTFAPTFRSANRKNKPAWYRGEDYVAALDGAIFNDLDFLTKEMSDRYDDPDTAAAAAYLREKPDEFPEKLDGHFALAIWDKKDRALCLVRDALGGKPLCYYHSTQKNLVVFASEPKAILRHPLISSELNHEALSVYLYLGYVPAPLSIFRGIRKVLPGEILRIGRDNTITKRSYFDFPKYDPQINDLREAKGPLRHCVIEATAKHIDGSEPVGSYLSGGVDSAIVLGVVDLLGTVNHQSFTLDYPANGRIAEFSDPYWADWLARRYDVRNDRVGFAEEMDQEDFCRVIGLYDEPFVHSNRAYGSYLLGKAANASGVYACLTGLTSGAFLGNNVWNRLQRIYTTVPDGSSNDELQLNSCRTLFGFEDVAALLVEPYDGARDTLLELCKFYRDGIEAEDKFDLLSTMVARMYMPEDLLVIYDRPSCLSGVEARHPFFDAQLMTLASRISPILRGKESKNMHKAALKYAFADLLPEEILNRRKNGMPLDYLSHIHADRLQKHFLS
ncbi:asparagine synthetase B, partial [bacterium]|nr:asparagine synthetase B [bacterium]